MTAPSLRSARPSPRRAYQLVALALSLPILLLLAPSVLAEEPPADAPPATATPSAQPETAPITTEAAAPVSEPDTEEPELPIAGYKKGFFLQTTDGSSKLTVNGRLQLRLTLGGEGSEGDVEAALAIPRARITFKGNLFTKRLKFKTQVDFAKGLPSLKDLMADYAIIKNVFHVRAGQFKKPFSREQLTSSGKLAFADRTFTDKTFGAGRDIGVMLHNGMGSKPGVEWAVGFFNGTSIKARVSGDVAVDPETGEGEITKASITNQFDDFAPMIVARAGYNFGKLKGYSSVDMEGGDFRFGVASSMYISFGGLSTQGAALAAELDFIIKVKGFALTGAGFLRADATDHDVDTLKLHTAGAYAEASMWIFDTMAPLLRYAVTAPTEGGAGTKQEALVGFLATLYGHNVKLVADGGLLTEDTDDGGTREWRVRTQLQVAF